MDDPRNKKAPARNRRSEKLTRGRYRPVGRQSSEERASRLERLIEILDTWARRAMR